MIGNLTIPENTLKLWIISSIGTNESAGEIDISATANPSSGFMGYGIGGVKGVNSVTYTFNFSFLEEDTYVYRFRSWNLIGGTGGGGSGSRSGNVPYTIKLNGNNIKTGSFNYATSGIKDMFGSLLQLLQENLCSEYKVYIKKNDILTINLDFSSISITGSASNSANIGVNPTAKVDSVILPT